MSGVDLGRYKRIVQLFWDPEPTNDTASRSPIWCLGKEYKAEATPPPLDRQSADLGNEQGTGSWSEVTKEAATPPDSNTGSYGGSGEETGGWPSAFLDDFNARLWFTYRSNFPPIQKSQDPKALASMSFKVRIKSQLVDQAGFTSDTGWGCMIRSGQSLLANALSISRLGRDWRRGSSSSEEKKILSLFADHPRAPFSIHKFVEHGAAACGKHPGEWFGPSATARCIQALTNGFEASGLKVYVNSNGSDVYEDKFLSIAKADGVNFKPTLILVGTRLGLEKITPVYWEALKASLQMPQSIGIAGGRPSSSHYFVGTQGQYLFYLDPHQTRPALRFPETPENYNGDDIESCHTRRLRRIHIKEMDPSMLIAFLIRDEDDWKEWRQGVQEVQGKGVIHVETQDPAVQGLGTARDGAIDEVETLDDDEEGGMVA